MGVIKASFCIVLVLNLVAAISIEEKKEAQEEFLSQLFDPTSGLLDEDTVRRFTSYLISSLPSVLNITRDYSITKFSSVT